MTDASPADVVANCNPEQPTFTVSIEARLRRAGKGKRLIVGGTVAGKPHPVLISLIARAFATRDRLLAGSDDSLEAMTRRLRATRGYLSALVRLSYLAPDIVRAILCGEQPVTLTARGLLASAKGLPVLWPVQREFLGFVRS